MHKVGSFHNSVCELMGLGRGWMSPEAKILGRVLKPHKVST